MVPEISPGLLWGNSYIYTHYIINNALNSTCHTQNAEGPQHAIQGHYLHFISLSPLQRGHGSVFATWHP